MDSGEIYRHDRLYIDAATGEIRAKYMLMLAPTRAGDWVARLLTSRQNMRPRNPPCFHGDPYPGYFLGVPGGPLSFDTWVDLRGMQDVDADDVRTLLAKNCMHLILRLPRETLVGVLDCAAGAIDTTGQQERALRDALARLR